jgi:Uma2 family endonuclease
MTTGTLISVEEYLASDYEPDCDYVDGRVEERNLGEYSHSKLQMRVGSYLLAHYGPQGIEVLPELRVQVKPMRFRVPDICLTLGDPGEEILTRPPFLCIEILSPEDRMSRVEMRINDFLEMGVKYVWVLDPYTKQAFTATAAEGLREVKSGVLSTEDPRVDLPLGEAFR